MFPFLFVFPSFPEIYKLAKAENDMELSIAAEECIKNNMEHVATTHEFTELPRIKVNNGTMIIFCI